MTSPDLPASPRPRSSRARWAVPLAAITAVTAAVAVPAAVAGGGTPDLTSRTPATLLADVAGSTATAVSGTVVQTSRLGLPPLPAGTTGTDPLALATGSHTLRVWADGNERLRLALLGPLAEYDVVRDGSSVWTYRSERNAATHYTLPAQPAQPGSAAEPPTPGLPTTPQQAAEQALAAVTPTTKVTVGDAVTVAGRDARTLVLTPDDATSLVGSVRIAVDDQTSAPLRVQVFAAADPGVAAVEVGFTDVSFTAPEASVFHFTAPKDAVVTDKAVPAPTAGTAEPAAPAAGSQPKPQVRGTGWTSIVVLSGLDSTALSAADPRLLDAVTTRVPEGRLLTSTLFSVLLTDDGRVLVGAVPPAVLRAAA